MATGAVSLSPAQRLAEDNLINGIAADGVDVLVLRGDAGFGKTTILERVQRAAGGVLLGMEQFANALAERQPEAIEEAFRELIEYALTSHDLAIMDDLHLISGGGPRLQLPDNLLNAALTAILASASERGKKLLFAVNDDVPWALWRERTRGESATSLRQTTRQSVAAISLQPIGARSHL
jgi:hypothetical protein